MASPTNFEESNQIINPPEGVTEEDCASVFAHVGVREFAGTQQPQYVTCWKLTKEELDEVNRTGNIWVGTIGRLPPHWVSGLKPLE